MGSKLVNIPDDIHDKLKKSYNSTELINRLLAKHFRAEEETNPNELKSYDLNRCDLCGSDKDIYFCERGHGKQFCYECMKATKRMGKHGRRFLAKCKDPDCNFLPYAK